jgi:hypothetical protein
MFNTRKNHGIWSLGRTAHYENNEASRPMRFQVLTAVTVQMLIWIYKQCNIEGLTDASEQPNTSNFEVEVSRPAKR